MNKMIFSFVFFTTLVSVALGISSNSHSLDHGGYAGKQVKPVELLELSNGWRVWPEEAGNPTHFVLRTSDTGRCFVFIELQNGVSHYFIVHRDNQLQMKKEITHEEFTKISKAIMSGESLSSFENLEAFISKK